MLAHLAAVGIGGAIGSLLRYGVYSICHHRFGGELHWLGTLVVNVLGCFIAGACLGLFREHFATSEPFRLFILVGLLGGFTTFSAFSADTLFLIRAGEVPLALGYMGLSTLLGILAVVAAFRIFS